MHWLKDELFDESWGGVLCWNNILVKFKVVGWIWVPHLETQPYFGMGQDTQNGLIKDEEGLRFWPIHISGNPEKTWQVEMPPKFLLVHVVFSECKRCTAYHPRTLTSRIVGFNHWTIHFLLLLYVQWVQCPKLGTPMSKWFICASFLPRLARPKQQQQTTVPSRSEDLCLAGAQQVIQFNFLC